MRSDTSSPCFTFMNSTSTIRRRRSAQRSWSCKCTNRQSIRTDSAFLLFSCGYVFSVTNFCSSGHITRTISGFVPWCTSASTHVDTSELSSISGKISGQNTASSTMAPATSRRFCFGKRSIAFVARATTPSCSIARFGCLFAAMRANAVIDSRST